MLFRTKITKKKFLHQAEVIIEEKFSFPIYFLSYKIFIENFTTLRDICQQWNEENSFFCEQILVLMDIFFLKIFSM